MQITEVLKDSSRKLLVVKMETGIEGQRLEIPGAVRVGQAGRWIRKGELEEREGREVSGVNDDSCLAWGEKNPNSEHLHPREELLLAAK